MLKPLRQFMLAKMPTPVQAVQALRAVFLAMFMAQVVLAGVLGIVLALLGDRQGSSPVLAQTFIFMSLVLLPATLFGSSQMAAAGGKQAALSATLLNAVILATPAWFLSFAFAVGVQSVYLLFLVAILLLYYALGLFSLTAFARAALRPPADVQKAAEDAPETSH